MHTLVLVVLGGLAVVYFAATESLDWAGRFEYMQAHYPGLLKWSEHQRYRVILALVGVCLLGTAIYELSKESHDVKVPQVFRETQPKSALALTPGLNQTVNPANAKLPKPRLRHQKGKKNQERESQKLMPAEKPGESKAASAPSPQQPLPMISAPHGIAIGGGNVSNPTVNNFAPADRHLTNAQQLALKSVAETMPEDAAQWFKVEAENTAESCDFGTDIRDAFGSKTGHLITRFAERSPSPRGVFVIVKNQEDPHFAFAQAIANALVRSNVSSVQFAAAPDLTAGTVKIVVGFHE